MERVVRCLFAMLMGLALTFVFGQEASAQAQKTSLGKVEAKGELTIEDWKYPDGRLYDEYTFEARQGQRLEVDLVSDDFGPMLFFGKVVGDSAVMIREGEYDDWDFAESYTFLNVSVEEDGKYFLHVLPGGPQERGAYELVAELFAN